MIKRKMYLLLSPSDFECIVLTFGFDNLAEITFVSDVELISSEI